jgi:ligand-binding sensor domain-containing protein
LAVVWRDGSGIRELTIGDFSVDPDIYTLAVIDRIVWASTPNGLLRYDVRKKQYRLFDRNDGLFEDFVQSIYPDGDYLWLGTQLGVQRFFWNNPYRID